MQTTYLSANTREEIYAALVAAGLGLADPELGFSPARGVEVIDIGEPTVNDDDANGAAVYEGEGDDTERRMIEDGQYFVILTTRADVSQNAALADVLDGYPGYPAPVLAGAEAACAAKARPQAKADAATARRAARRDARRQERVEARRAARQAERNA